MQPVICVIPLEHSWRTCCISADQLKRCGWRGARFKSLLLLLRLCLVLNVYSNPHPDADALWRNTHSSHSSFGWGFCLQIFVPINTQIKSFLGLGDATGTDPGMIGSRKLCLSSTFSRRSTKVSFGNLKFAAQFGSFGVRKWVFLSFLVSVPPSSVKAPSYKTPRAQLLWSCDPVSGQSVEALDAHGQGFPSSSHTEGFLWLILFCFLGSNGCVWSAVALDRQGHRKKAYLACNGEHESVVNSE